MVTKPTTNTSGPVPVLCPGGTVVCLASGPSLTSTDVDFVRGKATVLAVNDAWRLAPWADALIGSDAGWWKHYNGVPEFKGRKFCLEPSVRMFPDVFILKHTGDRGIDTDPTSVRTGRNSGAAAINLAVHFGAKRIVLLGYDMEARCEARSHFFGSHPQGLRGNSPYPIFRQMIGTMVEPLQTLGVEVLNCSRHTALSCFPRVRLEDVFA